MKRLTDLIKIPAMILVAALFAGSCQKPENDTPFVYSDEYTSVSTDITSITTSFSDGDETKIESVISRLKKDGIVAESSIHEDYLELEFSDGSHMVYPFIPEPAFGIQDFVDDDDLGTKADFDNTVEVFCGYSKYDDKKRAAQYNIIRGVFSIFNKAGYKARFSAGTEFTIKALENALENTNTRAIFIAGHGFNGNVVTGEIIAQKELKGNANYSPHDTWCDVGTIVNNVKCFNRYYDVVDRLVTTTTAAHGQLIFMSGCGIMSEDNLKKIKAGQEISHKTNAIVLGWKGKNTLGEAAAYILADRLADKGSVRDFLDAWHENDGENDEVKDLVRAGDLLDFIISGDVNHHWDRQTQLGLKTGFTTPKKKIKLVKSVAGKALVWHNFYYDKDEFNADYIKSTIYRGYSHSNKPTFFETDWFPYIGSSALDCIWMNMPGVGTHVAFTTGGTQFSVRYYIMSDNFVGNGSDEVGDKPDVSTFDLYDGDEEVILYGRSYKYENVRESGFRYYPKNSPSNVSSIKATGNPVFSARPSGLKSGTTYCAYAYVVDAQGSTHNGNVIEFTDKKGGNDPIAGNVEYVDLGLSVKWATCNLGATKPEDYGLYYQWGDTKGYGSDTNDGKYFDWCDNDGKVTYKWCNGSSDSLTKYNTDSEYGTVDNKTVLEMEDDAARAALGGKWRMPTGEESRELIDNCTSEWTTLNGVNGRKFTSKKTGYTDRWIFLPAAGLRERGYLGNAGSSGNYWTSSLFTIFPYRAEDIFFYSGSVSNYNNYNRYDGLPIRPVTE